MPLFLGIDTSNYTTSVALYDSDNHKDYSARKMLPVKAGEKVYRKDPLGLPGMVDGVNAFHFQIFCDDDNISKPAASIQLKKFFLISS